MKRHLIIICCIAGLIALGFYIEHSLLFQTTKTELRKRTVPSPPFQFDVINKILHQLGFQLLYPKEYGRYADKTQGGYELRDMISLDSTDPDYLKQWQPLSDVHMDQYPSSLIMDPQAVAQQVPILSVVVDQRDLRDPSTGIMANHMQKGKSWERYSFISYYDKGELLFATGAGVRIHGLTRKTPKVYPLRFYFRNLYGYGQFKPGILFGPESVPIRQIIARMEPNYRSMLAMDIAKRIGCLAPDYKPALVYLNGSRYGKNFVLIEHLNDKWLKSRYGHDNFIILRTTGHHTQRKNNAAYQKLLKWVNDPEIRITMAEAAQRVDVENLCRWFLSQFYTAGYDMYQGPILLDRTTPDAKWFWINWDMDGAWDSGVEPEREHIWQQENGIYNVMMNPERDRDNPKTARYQNEDARPILFRKLHHEDPLFRQYFERLFTDVMNHKLTPDYLEHWFQRRSQEILAIHPDTKPFLEEKLHPFITHRADYLRELMQTYFGAAQSVACTVEGMEDTKARIDGFDHAGNYTGWYFKGATITITLTDDKANTINHWLVNGQKTAAGSPTLTHTVEAATTIWPVFSFAR